MTKKILKPRRLLLMLIFSAWLSGCQKVYDYIHFPGKGDADYKSCAIQRIAAFYGDGIPDNPIHFTFTYNKLGDPVSVKNDNVGTGNPNLLFRYDKYNRLVQFIRPYENEGYESWHKYGYNSKNQIVRDTQYVFGDFIDSIPQPSTYEFRCTDYEYDGQNRIVGRTDSIFQSPGGLLESSGHSVYTYNSKGNLLSVPADVHYDNKMNILRTNKVWMFIAKDYSVNNPFTATAYNEYGLPLAFSSAYLALNDIVPLRGAAQVEYLCK